MYIIKNLQTNENVLIYDLIYRQFMYPVFKTLDEATQFLPKYIVSTNKTRAMCGFEPLENKDFYIRRIEL